MQSLFIHKEVKKKMLNRKGQNTAEYAILIALIVAGAIAMQTYIKRGFQGGVKYGVDRMGTGTTNQYEPYYMQQQYQTRQAGYTDSEGTSRGGAVTRVIGVGAAHQTQRSGNQYIANTTEAGQ